MVGQESSLNGGEIGQIQIGAGKGDNMESWSARFRETSQVAADESPGAGDPNRRLICCVVEAQSI
jgi:hypothetical protein